MISVVIILLPFRPYMYDLYLKVSALTSTEHKQGDKLFILPFGTEIHSLFKMHYSLFVSKTKSKTTLGDLNSFSQSLGYFLFEAGALVLLSELNLFNSAYRSYCLLLKHD